MQSRLTDSVSSDDDFGVLSMTEAVCRLSNQVRWLVTKQVIKTNKQYNKCEVLPNPQWRSAKLQDLL